MRSLIVYGTFNPQLVKTFANPSARLSFVEVSGGLHIRTEKVEGHALLALDKAKPIQGETVLNTVDILE